jgi:AraC-like DNA-binding protein
LVGGRAQRLLLNTNLTIKEISFQLGYDSQNCFSRAFKKSGGISPQRYRERAPGA